MLSAGKIDRSLVLLLLLLQLSFLALAGAQAASTQQQPQQPEVAGLQAHLNALQNQAQRQLNALAQQTQQGGRGAAMLEVLSNVGKAIQQQVSSAANESSLLLNTRKGEHSVGLESNSNLGQQTQTGQQQANYREQGELLRQEIVRRAGHLQQVVAGSMEALKSSSDLIVRRLLEQLNGRLDQAKSKADKIINEPATNEVAIRALNTINQGLNNVNNIITNIVNRLDLAATQQGQQAAPTSGASSQPAQASSPGASVPRAALLLDPNRLRMNLQQLGQQFSSAIMGQQQQQPAAKLPTSQTAQRR